MADSLFSGVQIAPPDAVPGEGGAPARVTVRPPPAAQPDSLFASVAVPPPSKGPLGYVDDAARALAQGATFGFADEVAAGMNSLPLIGTGKSYEENLADEKKRNEAIPGVIKYPGEIAGAVGGTIAAAPAAGALAASKIVGPVVPAALEGFSKLPGIVRAILAGGAGGALFGAGEADPGLENRAIGAGKGALIGGAAGGLISGVVAPTVGAIATGVRSMFNPNKQAARDIGRALERDNMTPAELMAGTAEAQAVRPNVGTIADAGGENVRGLVERVANTPGAGRTTVIPALTDRQQQQAARLSMDLAALTGTRRSAIEATTETMAQRATAATPLYRTALEEGDRAIFSPELERLTSSPSVKSSMAGAIRVWRDNAIADGYGAMNPGAMVDRGGILNMNGGNLPAFPNLQFWDYTKRILDDKVRAAIQAGQGAKARTLTRLTDQLRTELDTAVPSYRAAREAWGGPSQYLQSIEDGARLTSPQLGADEVRAAVRDMTGAQREGYVTGAVSSIFRRMGNDPAKLADMTKYFRSPEMRAKIEAIMPTPEAAAEWGKRLDFEVGSSELTAKALGNSRTAIRQAEQEDAAGIAIDLVASTLHGTPPATLLYKLFEMVPKRVIDTVRSRSDKIVADVLTNPKAANPEDLQRVLQMARGYMGPRSITSSVAPANAATGTALETK